MLAALIMILAFFSVLVLLLFSLFFFFNDTATTEIYTLSLHDALPISSHSYPARTTTDSATPRPAGRSCSFRVGAPSRDRKSTRLNSSHMSISYAVFCLKKKKKKKNRKISVLNH